MAAIKRLYLTSAGSKLHIRRVNDGYGFCLCGALANYNQVVEVAPNIDVLKWRKVCKHCRRIAQRRFNHA